MAFLAVLTVLLFFIAALGHSWWWREPNAWYGHAAFAWGMFFLSVYLTWKTIEPLL